MKKLLIALALVFCQTAHATSNMLASQVYQTQEGQMRNFYAPLSNEEKQNIRYIITTLANNSAISLMFYQTSLKQAGKDISHVHPLKMLEFIFSDPVLKRDVKKINGLPWKRFVEDTAKSLQDSEERDNLKQEHIEDFCKAVAIPSAYLSPAVASHNWVQFINMARVKIS